MLQPFIGFFVKKIFRLSNTTHLTVFRICWVLKPGQPLHRKCILHRSCASSAYLVRTRLYIVHKKHQITSLLSGHLCDPSFFRTFKLVELKLLFCFIFWSSFCVIVFKLLMAEFSFCLDKMTFLNSVNLLQIKATCYCVKAHC